MTLARGSDGALFVDKPAEGFFLAEGSKLTPVQGLRSDCLGPITEASRFLGDYVGTRTRKSEFVLSRFELSVSRGGGEDLFGNALPTETEVVQVQTSIMEPDRLRVDHPDGDLVVDHVGIGLAFAAQFGSRGSFMTEIYPLQQLGDCLSDARALAEEATQ
ncbi:hypothetical protein BC777_0002 [Yoonia maricola]|uniref:Uncharacterized protein n=1 Tax=Yoonia maricola TaxID=420999 RepID=A0A2M8WJR6_9RHOB|nr:hypothetical protein [Yoonia maricola]PJI91181.1 hypothetical protein BC777_0002 [Yoonia maricola]